ncbi:DUF4339 domain-containing protein [bacterium]|nr:DUF4339 domain-containing protein [bacterium]
MGWQIKTKTGALYGPVDSEVLQQWIQQKKILEEDFVWMEDTKEWVIIKSVSQLQDLFKEKKITPANKKRVPKVNIPTSKDLSETLYDDKSTLTAQLIADAWRAMLTKGIWSIIGAIFLTVIVATAGSMLLMGIIRNFPVNIIISNLITNFIWYLIVAALTLGWSAYSLRIARKEEVNVGSIFEGFKGQYIWRALGGYLLIALLTALASFVSFGIWGFYLTFAYLLTYFFIFDENKGPWEGMKASYDITKGYKWRILAVQTVCVLFGILFLGIGFIVTMPLANIAIASLYYRIRTDRISEKHLQTSLGEYLIVLIPFILIIVFIILMFSSVLVKQAPLILPQIQRIFKNLPVKI